MSKKYEHKFKIFLSLRQRITIPVSQIALAIGLFTVSPNTFLGLQHETCFMSPFWSLEFWGCSCILGTCVHPYFKLIAWLVFTTLLLIFSHGKSSSSHTSREFDTIFRLTLSAWLVWKRPDVQKRTLCSVNERNETLQKSPWPKIICISLNG